MNFFRTLQSYLIEHIHHLPQAQGITLDTHKVVIEPPKDPTHGDFSTNAAMVMAKQMGLPPKDLAQIIIDIVQRHPHVTQASVAGPGFVNAHLSPQFWCDQLRQILSQGTGYGTSTLGNGKNVTVEYVSVNPTGPMHAGHGRVAVVGDALASVYAKAGYRVVREYYINDEGGQIDVLARSLYLRYLEALGRGPAVIPEGLYPGGYLVPIAESLAQQYGACFADAPESEWLATFCQAGVAAMMDLIRDDLALLDIHHDVFTSERAIVEAGKVEEAVADLTQKGHVYEGILEPPKGLIPDDWEPVPLPLFRASDFGDDLDRPLKKSTGAWTYFAKDIAYHYDKYQRAPGHLVNVWGADHAGYVQRLKAAVKAFTQGAAELDVVLCQMVNLLDNGVPVKMSKRSGVFITLKDVVDQVGKDVVRLMMLSRKADAQLDFDLKKVLETSQDNPVFYIQYAYARCSSVLRQALETMGFDQAHLEAAIAKGDGTLLVDTAEVDLLKKLCQWPRLVEQSALHEEPHRIVYYIQEVASLFHTLWNRGKETTTLRFIQPSDAEGTAARLMLVQATQTVLASGLKVCGVVPQKVM